VNLLGVHQAETADTFAGRPRAGKPYDLSSVDWIGQGDDHEPFLAGAVASMSCALEQHYPAGSHIIFVGRTATLRWVDGPPLIYWARNYAAAAPLRRSDESRETIQQSGR
jgi:flavin reductase (DIM6/NTAB) family NADH-FMN oxidoreductase RutF